MMSEDTVVNENTWKSRESAFLSGVVVSVFAGAALIVFGSVQFQENEMSWVELLGETASAGFRGSLIGLLAGLLLCIPALRWASTRFSPWIQLLVVLAAGALTAVPITILDAVFGWNPGFEGILGIYAFFAGIWSAFGAWILLQLARRSRSFTFVLYGSASLLLIVGLLSYVNRGFSTGVWAIF
ncbi:hypothetical protein ACIPVK_16550 [Paeniglutamicibacter sp. MACA_103]|uniref:hypothetical protein n=1 Tax=Paeniglutamicibacter sp. MACA_103 TaxID=3377337 RepID=UPI003894F633